MKTNNKRKIVGGISFLFMIALAFGAQATEMGMNYYHETMMRDGSHYIDRSPAQVAMDLDDISTLTRNVKLYANPFFDENIAWVEEVASIAKAKGMHVVVVMNTEDRTIDDGNWNEYRSRVLEAASRFNGKADEFLVGNEIKLHSGWSPQEIKDRVAPLIDETKGRFSGLVSYEALYWEREPWLDYPGKVYINMYEHYPSFETNVYETTGRMGNRLAIGEFGELTDGGDGWPVRDEWAQADDIRKRWELIKQTGVPVAYIFTYREPSHETGFGLVRSDGSKKQAWYVFDGNSAATVAPKYIAPKQTTFVTQEPKVTFVPKTTQTFIASKKTYKTTFVAPSGVSRLPVHISQGTLVSDKTVGDCRTLKFSTRGELTQVQVCSKDGQYELSRQYGAEGVTVTVGAGSVDSTGGFAVFKA
jgi:hypothetical protein